MKELNKTIECLSLSVGGIAESATTLPQTDGYSAWLRLLPASPAYLFEIRSSIGDVVIQADDSVKNINSSSVLIQNAAKTSLST